MFFFAELTKLLFFYWMSILENSSLPYSDKLHWNYISVFFVEENELESPTRGISSVFVAHKLLNFGPNWLKVQRRITEIAMHACI